MSVSVEHVNYPAAVAALANNHIGTDNACIPYAAVPQGISDDYGMLTQQPRIAYARLSYQSLPFYTNLQAVVPPVKLQALMSMQKAAYRMGCFTFTQQLPISIEKSSDLLLRFFRLSIGAPQGDTLPPNAEVEVSGMNDNDKLHVIQLTQPAETVRFDLKPLTSVHAKPLIIPATFAKQPGRFLEVRITYTPIANDCDYAVGVFRATPSSIDREIITLKQNPIPVGEVRQSMIHQLQTFSASKNADDDIEVEAAINVALICPISKSRIKIPCRLAACPVQHTCDAYSFLQMNFQRPTWKCPVCKKDAHIDDLRYDAFVADLLTQFKNDDEVVVEAVCFGLDEKGGLKQQSTKVADNREQEENLSDKQDNHGKPPANRANITTTSFDSPIDVFSDDDDDDDDDDQPDAPIKHPRSKVAAVQQQSVDSDDSDIEIILSKVNRLELGSASGPRESELTI